MQDLVKQAQQTLVNSPAQPELFGLQVQVPLSTQKIEEPISDRTITTPPLTEKFVKGDRVFSQKFGIGTVIDAKQFGGQIKELVIEFDSLPDPKTLVVTAVKLA